MEHQHLQKNKVSLYERSYLGDGRYFQRGLCKGIKDGDTFTCFTEPKRVIKLDKLIKTRDARGEFGNSEDAKNAYFEAEFIDESFESGIEYFVLASV